MKQKFLPLNSHIILVLNFNIRKHFSNFDVVILIKTELYNFI